MYAQRPSPGGFGALLSDLLKPVKERSDRLARGGQKSVRADATRIHALADELEAGSAPAYAIFASDLDGVFVVRHLAESTPSLATLGPRPYLRPLRVSPRSLRAGLIVADRALARTFVAMGTMIDEVGDPLSAEMGKPNFGGFSGYQEPAARARAEVESARLWKDAAQRLLLAHQTKSLDYVAIGSHEELTEEIGRSLHPYLARLPRSSFPAGPHRLGLGWLRPFLADLDSEVRQRRHEALAGRVCDTAWSGGNAVLGLGPTLEAANAQAVESLVVAGQFARPGALCEECGYLTRRTGHCPVCGLPLLPVEDVVAELMEAVMAAGGRVSQIAVPSALDRSGIGALTRFPLGA